MIDARTVMLLVGLLWLTTGAPSPAADIQWDGSGTPPFGSNSRSWQNVDNWKPVPVGMFLIHRVPIDGDTATLNTPADDEVELNGNTAPINALTLGNGVQLDTNGYSLNVDDAGFGATVIAGTDTTLHVGGASGVDFRTDNLLITGGGELLFDDGGRVVVDGNASLFNGSIRNELGFVETQIDFHGDLTISSGSLNFVNTNNSVTFAPSSTILVTNISGLLILNADGLVSGTTARFEELSTFRTGQDMVIGPGVTVEMIGSILVPGNDTLTIDGGTLRFEGGNNNPNLVLPDGGSFRAENNAQVYFTRRQDIDTTADYEIRSGADLFNSETQSVGDHDSDVALSVSDPGSSLTAPELLVGESGTGSALVILSNEATANIGQLDVSHLGNMGSSNPNNASVLLETGATMNVSSAISVGTATNLADNLGQVSIRSGASLTHTGMQPINVGAANSGNGLIEILDDATLTTGQGDINIHPLGELDVSGRAEINGPLLVKGQVLIRTLTAGPGVLLAAAPVTVDGGTIELDGGVLRAGSVNFINSGQFDFGAGRLTVGVFGSDLIVPADGVLAPGPIDDDSGAGDTAITGDYFQQPGGTLEIEIGGLSIGTEHDFVNVGGSAALDGDLMLSLIDGFLPVANDAFTIFNANSLLGNFDNVANGTRLDALGGQGSFLVHYGIGSSFDPDQIVLSDFLQASADTEPDGDVDGADFLAIQRTNPSLILTWESQYGMGTSLLATSLSVPEPHALALASILLLVCFSFLRSC